MKVQNQREVLRQANSAATHAVWNTDDKNAHEFFMYSEREASNLVRALALYSDDQRWVYSDIRKNSDKKSKKKQVKA